MDRRRPLSELKSKELIKRLNNANSSLNEKLTILRKLVKYKEEAMDKMWKRISAITAEREAYKHTKITYQKQLNALETRLTQLYDDMDHPEEFGYHDAHYEVEALIEAAHAYEAHENNLDIQEYEGKQARHLQHVLLGLTTRCEVY